MLRDGEGLAQRILLFLFHRKADAEPIGGSQCYNAGRCVEAWRYSLEVVGAISGDLSAAGGAKHSGIGTEFAEEGLAEFTQLQIINEAR